MAPEILNLSISGPGLTVEFFRGVLESAHLKLRQRSQELGARHAGNLSRPALGQLAQFVPLRGRSQAHLTDEVVWILRWNTENRIGHLDGNSAHLKIIGLCSQEGNRPNASKTLARPGFVILLRCTKYF